MLSSCSSFLTPIRYTTTVVPPFNGQTKSSSSSLTLGAKAEAGLLGLHLVANFGFIEREPSWVLLPEKASSELYITSCNVGDKANEL